MPVILYEIWAFVTPGLTRPERRLVWPLLGAALVLFAAGVGLGYLFIPLAVGFLLDFSVEGVRPLLGLADYIGFVTTFMLAFGIALQFPVILYLLARVGHPQLRLPCEPPALCDPADRARRNRHHPGRPRDQLVHARARHVRPLRDHAPADPDDRPIASPVTGSVLLLTDARDRCACARRAIPSVRLAGRRRRPGSAMPPAAGSWSEPAESSHRCGADARPRPGLRRRARRGRGPGRRVARPRNVCRARVHGGGAARGRGHDPCGARGGRRGRRGGVRRRSSAGPPRPSRRGSGFCLVNNVAIAVAALRADGVGSAGRDRRLGRPPRQRNPGDLRRRRGPHLHLDAPVSVLSGHRRRGR